MKTIIEVTFKVTIIVNKKKFCSVEQIIDDLNHIMNYDLFEKFGATVDKIKDYYKIKTEFNLPLQSIFIQELFNLKSKMPPYIYDIYFN
jgi:hypothetical protein